jgi:hypothetical protein
MADARRAFLVAIGRHHHDRQIRAPRLDLVQQAQPVHPGMLISDRM